MTEPEGNAMNSYSRLAVCCLFLALPLVSSCGGGGSDTPRQNTQVERRNDFDYHVPTASELAQAKAIVASRDLRPQNVQIVHQASFDENHTITILSHSVESITHHGAVVSPKKSAFSKIPVIVLADGQGNRTINMEPWINRSWGSLELQQAIVVIPGFRGRTLMFRGVSWVSTGSTCDEFDSAATDSIALINAVQTIMPEGNFEKYLVRGHSRGGNTALLMSERDSRVAVAISASAPVDFYRRSMWVDATDMYECQFLQNKTATESRMRMLNSSPVFFAADAHGIIDIHQGSLDTIAHPWNAQIMGDALKAAGKDVNVYYYDKGHADIWEGPLLGERFSKRMRDFLANHGQSMTGQ